MLRFLILIFLVSFIVIENSFSQNNKLLLDGFSVDTVKCNRLLKDGKNIFNVNPDSSLKLWLEVVVISKRGFEKSALKTEKYTYGNLLSSAYRKIGVFYQTKEDLKQALNFYNKAYEISTKINAVEEILSSLKNISSIYENYGDIACKKNNEECLLSGIKKSNYYLRKAIDLVKKTKDDKEYALLLNRLAYVKINEEKLDSAETYLQLAADKFSLLQQSDELLSVYYDLVYVLNLKSDLKREEEVWSKIFQLLIDRKDREGLAKAYYKRGVGFHDKGDIQKAIDYYQKSLKIYEELNLPAQIAEVTNTLGIIYKLQADIKKSLEYHNLALQKYLSIKDTVGIATVLNNIGNVLDEFGDPQCQSSDKKVCWLNGLRKALDYYNRSLLLSKSVNYQKGIASALNNIGSIYNQIGEPNCHPPLSDECLRMGRKKALNFLFESLNIKQAIDDKQGVAYSFVNIADVYYKQGDFEKAKQYAEKSLKIARQLGYPENIRNSSEILYWVYKKERNFMRALEMHELFVEMKEMINNETTRKESVRKQLQFEYEKKATADSVKNANEKALKNAEILAQKAKLKQERTMRYALYGGVLLLGIFGVFMFNRYKFTERQKQIIELQKKEVEQQREISESRRLIAEEQREIIKQQKEIVEEKQKEITDSIHYASRIQRAMLTSESYISNNIQSLGSDYFVFYQPKDIVSGDFYWALSTSSISDKQDKIIGKGINQYEGDKKSFYLCVADCTGHGVPGAFMSLLNISFLNELVIERGVRLPHEILNEQRKLIIRALNPTGKENAKDGMDCVLYFIDYGNFRLHMACANNPLWIVRKRGTEIKECFTEVKTHSIEFANQDFELIEFKPNKMPVGLSGQEDKPFIGGSIEIYGGDLIYSFTDGFADQFGGEKGKKFMYKPFKELLLSICHLPMNEQKEILKDTINNWMTGYEQIDDILVAGIRI